MDGQRVRQIVDALKFRDWTFEIGDSFFSGHIALRATFTAPDNYSNPENSMQQWTRWWVIEPDDTDDGVVKTALLCVLTAVEHEAREEFFYNGRRVFSPHRRP